MNRIGIGVVGCGHWGKNYVRVFSELPGSEVVGVCDLSTERLDKIKEGYPSVHTTTDLQRLLARPDLDALVIATPATTHYQIARQCLLAGKDLLVEKPLTVAIEHGEELIVLAEEHRKVLMVGHTFLYNAGIRKLKECMAEITFGQVYYVHSTRTNLGPIREDVNVLWDLATHDVSIFNYLLDSTPLQASAVGAHLLSNGREDVAFLTLLYPTGVVGNVHVSWADPNKVRQVVAVGSRRRIVFNDLSTLERVKIFEKGVRVTPVEVNGFGEFRLTVRDGDIVSPKIEASEPLKNQCLHFLECIRTRSRPLSDGQNGLAVVRTILAVEHSMRNNGAPELIGRESESMVCGTRPFHY